ncbi:hypothetical protein BHE74_00029293 [Ensete ventricosum]|nr:hypothetical protein BHE74_00029293 [Ensete ventricosum]
MRTNRYRAVPPRSILTIGSRLREKSTVDGRLREKKEEEEEKKKEEEEKKKEVPPRLRVVAARGSPAHRYYPRPWAIFLLREETKRLPARGERSRRRCPFVFFF